MVITAPVCVADASASCPFPYDFCIISLDSIWHGEMSTVKVMHNSDNYNEVVS